jgi:branched-chain amino acid aminotransferase
MTAPQELYALINQEFVPVNKAYLHVSDLSIQRGYGIFDYFKVSKGHPFFLKEYLNRFESSARLMGLAIPFTQQALEEKIYKLIHLNKLDESGIKMILTGGYSPDGYQPTAPNLIITQHQFSLPAPEQYEKGIKIIICSGNIKKARSITLRAKL